MDGLSLMRQLAWSDVPAGSVILGRNGLQYRTIGQSDASKITLEPVAGGAQVSLVPQGPAQVLSEPLPSLEPVRRNQAWDAVDETQSAADAKHLDWIAELPAAEAEAVMVLDRILTGEWESQVTTSKNWLIEDQASMTVTELLGHMMHFHGIGMSFTSDEAVGVEWLREMHAEDHQRNRIGDRSYLVHTHDIGTISRYELLRRMADAGVLYATKQRNEAQTYKEAVRLFGEHPQTTYMSRCAVEGQRSGHEICVCDNCLCTRLMKPNAKSSCKMTPGCKGKMERIAPRPQRFKP